MRRGELRIIITARDEATAKLRRVRYPFLTPIGSRIPPRGTTARAVMEAGVARRRFVRVIFASFGIHQRLDFAPLWRKVEWFGIAYVLIVGGVIIALILTQWLPR